MGMREEPQVEGLLRRAGQGDHAATQELLARFQGRLRQMVAVRMDPRLAARLDPSDVVQEALIEVLRKLPEYLRDRPLPFYPWLRRIAWERLVHLHTRHLRAKKRSVSRTEPLEPGLSDESAMQLAERLISKESNPISQLLRKELRGRVRRALEQLEANDREVLVLRYLEKLSVKEIAAILEIREGAVSMRHVRALERLRAILGDIVGEDRS